MVSSLAFFATAVSTLFAQATAVRFTRKRKPHELAWTAALAMFALAAAMLAMGETTGWDAGTFRTFYLFGAVLNVGWLALGSVYLLLGPRVGRRCQAALLLYSGFAAGVILVAPMDPIDPRGIPVGKDVFGALPRVLAAVGSSVGAAAIFIGAAYSAVRFLRNGANHGSGRMAASNTLIALGTIVLSSGGIVQGSVGHDEAFAITLALGISVIYLGFRVAALSASAGSARITTPSDT